MSDFDSFSKDIRRVHDKRKIKIKNSYDTKDFYRNYIKGVDKQSDQFVTELQYGMILRITNDLLTERLLDGYSIVFPFNLGSLQLCSLPVKFEIRNGELYTNSQIDWYQTLKLWHEDEDCKQRKQFVRSLNKYKYIVKYMRSGRTKKNFVFLSFNPSRHLIKKIGDRLESDGINTLI